MDYLASAQSLLGLTVFLVIAWGLSDNRPAARWRIAFIGASVQLLLGVLFLKVPLITTLFAVLNDAVLIVQAATSAGTAFVFGYLGGGPLPYEETRAGGSFILALRALPLIIVVSALTSLLVYWRILPVLVHGLSLVLQKTLGIGGALGLGTGANIFIGMVEAPLFIAPYLKDLTRSELFVLMCTGMATIAGTVLVLYATVIGQVVPDAVGHLLAASVLSAPAAITIALLMVPETGTSTKATLNIQSEATGAMDAITQGTQSGLQLFLNVSAMLLVLVALVSLANSLLGLAPDIAGAPLSLERILGVAMAPVTWLMGIPASEMLFAGSLMGTKTILNEFLAYLQMAGADPQALDQRSRLIMTYALCGFANFGSLGIMVGGLTTLVPERRSEIIALGFKSLVGGTLATCCTGAVVGIVT